MSTPTRRSLAAPLAALASLAVVAATLAAVAPVAAASPNLPDRIDLPNGWLPEGIESQGRWLYSGSRADGAVYRADARTGQGSILVEGETGNVAVGLHIDDRGRLWVAGGPTQEVNVHDLATGERLAVYTFPGTGFLNDLDIVDGSVYVTDSPTANLGVIPLGADGSLLMFADELVPIEGAPAEAIDTTGAGDMYAAGLLYGLTNGLTRRQAGHLASHAAARVVSQLGARLAKPFTGEEIAALSSIKEDDGVPKAEDMIARLVEGHEAVARTARAVFPIADEANDQPTCDLLTQRLQVHEKTAWMLRSLLE